MKKLEEGSSDMEEKMTRFDDLVDRLESEEERGSQIEAQRKYY